MTNTNKSTVSSSDTFIVHKEGEEGTLVVHRLDGRIVTPLDERPDWAEGLSVALVQERITFYEKRFGAESAAFKSITDETQAVEFTDLGWLGVSADQQELSVDADPHYRSEVIAKALGIDTETGEMPKSVLAEHEVSRDNPARTAKEMQALEESVQHGFTGGARAETMNERDRQSANSR